jgi:hypothetical protein
VQKPDHTLLGDDGKCHSQGIVLLVHVNLSDLEAAGVAPARRLVTPAEASKICLRYAIPPLAKEKLQRSV